MIETILGLILSTLSIVGGILNIFKHRSGFLLWIVGNSGWIFFDYYIGLYTQIPIWIVYLASSIYGYYLWTKNGEKL